MKRVTVVGLLLATVLLCGCASGRGDSEEEFREFLAEERLRLFVTATWDFNEPLPPGSTVRATLYDETAELKPAISSHAHTTRGERSVAVLLEVTYPLEELEADHEHVLRGTIRDPDGKILFESATPIVLDVELDENMDWYGNPLERRYLTPVNRYQTDDGENWEDREQRIQMPMVPLRSDASRHPGGLAPWRPALFHRSLPALNTWMVPSTLGTVAQGVRALSPYRRVASR